MSARSPSTPASFGDGARVAGLHDGHISGAHSEDEDGDFERMESFPLTSLALGPWHARHVSLRLYFPTGRFVFVVVRRRRAEKASAFGRTAELVTRHVARRLHVDVPMSPFASDARGGLGKPKRACGDRGPNGGFNDRSAVPSPTRAAPFETFEPRATASVAGSVAGTSGVAFAEGSRSRSRETASLARNHTTRRRSKHVFRTRDHVTTYAVDHDDVVGLNYVNPLCADGRLAMEARRVVKRAHATLDDAVASFATNAARGTRGVLLNASNATPTVTLDDVFDRRRGVRGSRAAGVGRAGARRFPGKKNAPGSPKARKRSRLDADPRVSENTSENTFENTSGVLAETSDISSSPRTPPRDDEYLVSKNVARRFAPDAAERESRASLDASPDATPTKSHTSPHRYDDTDDNGCDDQTVFRDQTVFLCFDDPRVSAALRDVVTAERRLLALAEDGIPVWALVMASCGLYYRPWLRTAARLAFVALALWSAAAGARDVFRFCVLKNAFAKTKTGADGVDTSSPAVSAVSSASANTLFLGSLAWTGGARLGLVDARAVRALTAALGAGARALARVFAFVGYVVGRIVAHRLSLAISIRRAWRGLPGMWADAHGFVVASETDASRKERGAARTTAKASTTEKASGGDFRAETFASPRRRKPETPARGAPTTRRAGFFAD